MTEFWLYVTLAGILASQILVGMYMSIFIYERILKHDDSKHLLSGSIDPDHCRLADVHSDQDNR